MSNGAAARVYYVESPKGDDKVYLYRSDKGFGVGGMDGSSKESFDVAAVVLRASSGHKLFDIVTYNTPIHVNDIIKTAPDSSVGVELSVGGKVSVKRNSTVKLVNDGEVRVLEDGEWRRIVLNSGGAWAKFQKTEKPLTIQTRGGVLGIKG